MAQKTKQQVRARRKQGLRKRISGTSERPRLSVFRSAKHIYAQLIDDTVGVTLGSASSQKISGAEDKTATSIEVGKAIAAAAKEAGINKVVFDRNGFIYHGRVAAVAKGAREAGLEF
jgi:large subunit ribosomal protein L18